MARSLLLCAVAVALVAASTVSAAGKGFPYGSTMSSPSLFASTGYDYDHVIFGVRVAYYNQSTPAPPSESEGMALASEATTLLASQLNSCFGSQNLTFTNYMATEGKVVMAYEDGKAIAMFPVQARGGGAHWPSINAFYWQLHLCFDGMFPMPLTNNQTSGALGYGAMDMGMRVFEVNRMDALAQPPRMRIQAMVYSQFNQVHGATNMSAMVGDDAPTAMFPMFYSMCLLDGLEEDGFEMKIMASNVHVKYAAVHEDEDNAGNPTGNASMATKIIIDFPFDAPIPDDDDDDDDKDDGGDDEPEKIKPTRDWGRHMNGFHGKCFQEALAIISGGDDYGFVKVAGAQAVVVSSASQVTSNMDGGVGIAMFHNAAGYMSDMKNKNGAMAEAMFAEGINNARRYANDTRRATPAWVDVLSVTPIGNDLVVRVRVSPDEDQFKDFFVQDDVTGKIEAGLEAMTSGTDVTFFNVDDDGRNRTSGGAMVQFDVMFEDDRAGRSISDADMADYATLLATVAYNATRPSANDCAGCDAAMWLNGDNNMSRPMFRVDYDMTPARVAHNVVVVRGVVYGHEDDISRWVARMTSVPGAGLQSPALLSPTGCASDASCGAGVNVELVRIDRNPFYRAHGMHSGAQAVVQLAGVSFTTANSREFKIVVENAFEMALNGSLTTSVAGILGNSAYAITSLDGCGYTGPGLVTCQLSLVNGRAMMEDGAPMYAVSTLTDAARTVFSTHALTTALAPVWPYAAGKLRIISSQYGNAPKWGSALLAASVPANDVNVAVMNSRLPDAVTKVWNRYFAPSAGPMMNNYTWAFAGPCGGTTGNAVCSISFAPEAAWPYMDEKTRESFLRAVGYTLATRNNIVPDGSTPREEFQGPFFTPLSGCADWCNVTETKNRWMMRYTMKHHAVKIIINTEDVSDDWNRPTMTIARMAALYALGEAGYKVPLSNVFVTNMDGREGKTIVDVEFFTAGPANASQVNYEFAQRRAINQNFLGAFGHLTVRRFESQCIPNLYVYATQTAAGSIVKKLATDDCTLFFNSTTCDSMSDGDHRVIDDGMGNKYYLSSKDFMSTGLHECGCDTSYPNCYERYSDRHD